MAKNKARLCGSASHDCPKRQVYERIIRTHRQCAVLWSQQAAGSGSAWEGSDGFWETTKSEDRFEVHRSPTGCSKFEAETERSSLEAQVAVFRTSYCTSAWHCLARMARKTVRICKLATAKPLRGATHCLLHFGHLNCKSFCNMQTTCCQHAKQRVIFLAILQQQAPCFISQCEFSKSANNTRLNLATGNLSGVF